MIEGSSFVSVNRFTVSSRAIWNSILGTGNRIVKRPYYLGQQIVDNLRCSFRLTRCKTLHDLLVPSRTCRRCDLPPPCFLQLLYGILLASGCYVQLVGNANKRTRVKSGDRGEELDDFATISVVESDERQEFERTLVASVRVDADKLSGRQVDLRPRDRRRSVEHHLWLGTITPKPFVTSVVILAFASAGIFECRRDGEIAHVKSVKPIPWAAAAVNTS